MLNIKVAWLTLNRMCNLRCDWCYASKTNFNPNTNMKFEDAIKAIDICSDLKVDHITLIGGEPTLYSRLVEVIQYCKQKGLKVTLVTNAVRLADKDYLDSLIKAGVDVFGISIKGENSEEYIKVAKVDRFNEVMTALDNLIERDCRFSTSMVLTCQNIPNIAKGLKEIFKKKIRMISLAFCYEFNYSAYANEEFKKNNHPCQLINLFMKHYDEIDQATQGRFRLGQSFPACMWDQDFLEHIYSKGQMSAVCCLVRGSGLVFDTDLSLLPCNPMTELKIGKYGVDFTDKDSLVEYLHSDKLKKIYSRLRGIPSIKCKGCKLFPRCGGGCVAQYTNYTFDELMALKEEYKEMLTWKK